MIGSIREVAKRIERSNKWPKVRKEFMAIPGNDMCAACGKKASWRRYLQVHHIVPFSVDPSKELDHDNLITLCGHHHLWVGHLGWFQSWNPNVVLDAMIMLERIQNRPTKADPKSVWWKKMFEL